MAAAASELQHASQWLHRAQPEFSAIAGELDTWSDQSGDALTLATGDTDEDGLAAVQGKGVQGVSYVLGFFAAIADTWSLAQKIAQRDAPGCVDSMLQLGKSVGSTFENTQEFVKLMHNQFSKAKGFDVMAEIGQNMSPFSIISDTFSFGLLLKEIIFMVRCGACHH